MYPKAIFFDLYQTLINVDIGEEGKKAGFEKAIIPYLLKRGITKPEALLAQSYYDNELESFYANHNIEIFQHNFPVIFSKMFSKYYNLTISKTKMSDLIYEFRKISRGHFKLYKGVREVLEILSKQYILAIASHTQGLYTERELEELDILKYFKHRVYTSDIGFKKKSDNFYKKCLEIVGLKPNNCVMVGDSLYEDMYMASKNGMHTIWMMNPLTKEKNKVKTKPEASLSVESMTDLPNIVKEVFS